MESIGSPRFRLLGHLALDGGHDELRGIKQRMLLAYLLFHSGQIVSTERLVDAVWGDQPPATANAIVHGYVRRVRHAIGGTGAELRTQAPGYLLDLGDEELDVRVFERLAREGKRALESGDSAQAGTLLGGALSLWRGELLADLPPEGFVVEERLRLGTLRIQALLDRVEADLMSGGGESLVPELETAVREQPFQERPRRQLMLALYRAGRQADALALYRETRQLFSDELGLEPSRQLQQLQAAILRHDTSLDAPEVETPTATPPVQGRSRKTVVLAAAAIVVAAVGTFLGVDLATSARTKPQPFVRPARIIASLDLPQPSCCSYGFGALWGVGHHDDLLRRINSAGTVTGHWQVADFQSGVPLAAAGSVWIPSAAGSLIRFDPATQTVAARIPEGGSQLAFAFLTLWETTRDHRLVRINLATDRPTASIRVAPGVNDWDDPLVAANGSIWVAVADKATLVRINPADNTIIARITGFGDTDSGMPLAADGNAIWALRFLGGQLTLFRVDPTTNTIAARIPVGAPNGSGLAGTVTAGAGYVWTANWNNSISKVDPHTNRVVATYTPPAAPQNINFENGSLWVDAYDASKVWRIDPNS